MPPCKNIHVAIVPLELYHQKPTDYCFGAIR